MLPDFTMGQGSSLNDADSSFARSGAIYGDTINTTGPNNGWIAQLLGGQSANPALWIAVGAIGAVLLIKLARK